MELSVFTYKTSKSIPFNMPSRFKDIVFIKFDGKVYIEATIVGVGGGNTIYMPYDLLMRHRYLKHYYELSRKAIGKPNLDADYYGSEDPEKCKAKCEHRRHLLYLCRYDVYYRRYRDKHDRSKEGQQLSLV